MRYVIVTTEWLNSHGIEVPAEARKSLDGTKVIMHERMVLPVVKSSEDLSPVSYEYDDPKLWEILNGVEWSEPTEEGIL